MLCSRRRRSSRQATKHVGSGDVGRLARIEPLETVAVVIGLEQRVVRGAELSLGVPGAKQVDVGHDGREQDRDADVRRPDATVEVAVHAGDCGVLGDSEPGLNESAEVPVSVHSGLPQ